EDSSGAIHQFSPALDLKQFDAIVLGPGLTIAAAQALLPLALPQVCPLLLDADALTALAQKKNLSGFLSKRSQITVLTPHPGEFHRLFPNLSSRTKSKLTLGERAELAAQSSGAIVVLKGAKTAIAHPQGVTWINGDSTPALARGGSGDVLAGLMGGLMAIAQAQGQDPAAVVKSAVWWHSQAGVQLAQERSVLGVDAWHLSQGLYRVVAPQA
ncbi:MAG: NAD(P)H-hydrate dehydratase, partial [Prochlorothrix sp.]